MWTMMDLIRNFFTHKDFLLIAPHQGLIANNKNPPITRRAFIFMEG